MTIDSEVRALLDRPVGRDDGIPPRDWRTLQEIVWRPPPGGGGRHDLFLLRAATMVKVLVQPDLPLPLFEEIVSIYFYHPRQWSNINLKALVWEIWTPALGKHPIAVATERKIPDIITGITKTTMVHVRKMYLQPERERKILSLASFLINDDDALLTSSEENGVTPRTTITNDIVTAYHKTRIMLESRHPESLLLHSAIQSEMPNFVIYVIAKWNPKQLLQYDNESSSEGVQKLALHIASNQMATEFYMADTTYYHHGENQWDFRLHQEFPIVQKFEHLTPIPLLCHLCPTAARYAASADDNNYYKQQQTDDRDDDPHRGHTPLETLLYQIYSHPRSSISRRYTHVKRTQWNDYQLALEHLLSAAPEAIETRHPATKLYPFCIAAQEPTVEKDQWWDQLSLNLTYFLLRWNPGVIDSRRRP